MSKRPLIPATVLLLTAITIGSAIAGFQEAFQSSHPDLSALIETNQATLKPFSTQCNLMRLPGQCIIDRTLLAFYTQYPRQFCRLAVDHLSRTKDTANSDLFRLFSKHMTLGKTTQETLLSQIQLIKNQSAYRDTLYHWLLSNTSVLKAFQLQPEFRERVIYTITEDILDKNPITIASQAGGNRLPRRHRYVILGTLSRHLGVEIGLIETDKKKNASYKLFTANSRETLEPLLPGTQFWSSRLMNPKNPGDRKLVLLETPEGAAFLLNTAHSASPENGDDRSKERGQKEYNDDNFEQGVTGKPPVDRTPPGYTRDNNKTQNTSRKRGEQKTGSSSPSFGGAENIREPTDKAPYSYWDLAKMWWYISTSSKTLEITTASLVDAYYYLRDGKIPDGPPGDQPRIPKKASPLPMDAPYPEHRNWQLESFDDPG